MDGESVYLVDFERAFYTLITHTDDISLQFRTSQLSVPLFYAVSPVYNTYFGVSLVNGNLQVETNINDRGNPISKQVSDLEQLANPDSPNYSIEYVNCDY